jgi:hypothetical protein
MGAMQIKNFFSRIWPRRNNARKARFSPSARAFDGKDLTYVSRPRIEQDFDEAIAQGDNIVLYGPPHQGKTMLLNQHVTVDDSLYIECRPGFKRTQIYRVVLSNLGYAVLVEKKRRGKVSTTVKLSLASTGGEASAEGEVEQTLQAVTVDLKNPAEVAQLISRIKRLPWLILNNFQLLDAGTKRSLLFDLTFFTERPNIHIIIIGSWTNEDYLEELEPAVAGRFKYIQVPVWKDADLRRAAGQWTARMKTTDVITPHLDEFLSLASGDISLFRAFVEGSIEKGETAPAEMDPANPAPTVQSLVLGRFRRGLRTRLKEILRQRDSYVTYAYLNPTSAFVNNPKFEPVPNLGQSGYISTSINPQTNRPYLSGGQVLLDQHGNPQYLEVPSGKIAVWQTDIARFLLTKFHAAVQQGIIRIDLSSLAQDFAGQLNPKPLALDDSRLKAAFRRFDEVQRQAFIVPHMLAVDNTGECMEITDRRLTLFLQNTNLEDIEELLEDVQPRQVPDARRRNYVSVEMTAEEQNAYIRQAYPDAVLVEVGVEEDEEDEEEEEEDSDEGKDASEDEDKESA